MLLLLKKYYMLLNTNYAFGTLERKERTRKEKKYQKAGLN